MCVCLCVWVYVWMGMRFLEALYGCSFVVLVVAVLFICSVGGYFLSLLNQTLEYVLLVPRFVVIHLCF